MKLFLGLFIASCWVWGLARLIGWENSIPESELMIAVDGHQFMLSGWKAEAAALPFVMLCLWASWVIVKPALPWGG